MGGVATRFIFRKGVPARAAQPKSELSGAGGDACFVAAPVARFGCWVTIDLDYPLVGAGAWWLYLRRVMFTPHDIAYLRNQLQHNAFRHQ